MVQSVFYNEGTSFLGRPYEFWQELDRRFTSGDLVDAETLLTEVIALRGKVSFYESRIKQMASMLEQK